ncbi:hypothetical protein QJS10_CPB14g00391 [Acorus calamus]|uniref:Uncharacterized protein n=1 Tax=Acorus calamus TaxID=4465 RepID=A0AAV9DAD9_ACOCL|nr:hypothetical protein QJS10_CPB14g00391 [Acorus calamus]
MAKKMGLGIRLLPASAEDAATAACITFSSKFEKNRKNKRAVIKATSIFPNSSLPSSGSLLTGRVKPSSWTQSSSVTSLKRQIRMEGKRCKFFFFFLLCFGWLI